MRTYNIKTAFTEYTILSNSFDEAYQVAGRIREREQREFYGSDEEAEILSIVTGDAITATPKAPRKKKGGKK